MAAFGWSAGDIVASIQLVVKIAGALKETGGARSDYQESVEFLFGLEITLQNLRSIAPIIVTPSQQDILQFEVEKIAKPLSDFFAEVQKFDAALGLQSKRGAWRTAPRKVQWAMSVSKEVQNLRDRISIPISSLNIMLQSQTLYAISNLQQKFSGDVSDRIASTIEIAVSNGLKLEIDNLKNLVNTSGKNPGSLNQQARNTVENDIHSPDDRSMPIFKHNDEESKNIARHLGPQAVHASSRLEQLIHEQSSDLKELNLSLNTIIKYQELPSYYSPNKTVTPLRSSMLELKKLFTKCMYLLALSLRDFFKEALLYLGPQLLILLLTLQRFGSSMPRLLLGDRILFEDVLGRQKYLPVEFFKHYSVFTTFLKESFEGVPGQKYVLNRRYLLKDASNRVVDSTKWARTVAKRSNITMSVLIGNISDEEVACPRCWILESITRPGTNIQCSSCGLIYQPPATRLRSQKDIKKKSSTLTTLVDSDNLVEEATTDEGPVIPSIPMTGESMHLGKATVTDFSKNLDSLRSSDSRINPTNDLPWDYEDLVYFKRVQIAETKSLMSPHLSTLNRLLSVFARLREETLKARLKNNLLGSEKTKKEIDAFIPLIDLCPKNISSILRHPYFESFFLHADVDQRSRIWSQAWASYTHVAGKSKVLVQEARKMYQELKDHRILHLMKGDPGLQRAEMILELNNNLRSFLNSLQIISQIESAWTSGGIRTAIEIETPRSTINNMEFEDGLATSLEVTLDYIIVAFDNGHISIFKHNGEFSRTLVGHVMGVWALATQDDTLISAGVDRDVRVWKISTGEPIHNLRGHTSTIRCIKFINKTTAISGSRDTTLRVWDLKKGLCQNVLVGHQAAARCVDARGDIIVSGSYDTTAKVWSLSEDRCLRTLSGHVGQIYCIAFDGNRMAATGSLDTSIRVWDIINGSCQAILKGHTSLVGQIQLSNNTLVTGSSDGSVRVWSLQKLAPIHSFSGADNSITSLSFDHKRILAGSSDGKTRVLDTRTGVLVRELGDPKDAVWKVHLGDTMAVILSSKSGRIIIEIWSFLNSSLDSNTEVLN